MLEAKDILVELAGVKILSDVSFSIEEKEIVTLIGPNGAGKTSTLNTVMGIFKPTNGTIFFCGQSIKGLPPELIVSRGISIIPEGRRIFAPLTVVENLKLGAVNRWNREHIKRQIEKMMDLFPALNGRAKQLAGSLSGGEQQMLAIARGLMSDPRMLLLDEPSMGLAPLIVADIFRILKEINERGTTILLVEQNASLAIEFANRGYVLVAGRIIKSGLRTTLLQDEFVKRAYLGQQN